MVMVGSDAIYATLETSRSLPKEDQSAKISFPKEMNKKLRAAIMWQPTR